METKQSLQSYKHVSNTHLSLSSAQKTTGVPRTRICKLLDYRDKDSIRLMRKNTNGHVTAPKLKFSDYSLETQRQGFWEIKKKKLEGKKNIYQFLYPVSCQTENHIRRHCPLL